MSEHASNQDEPATALVATDQVLSVLEGARALVERGWTQKEYARDASGKGVCSADKSAVYWCAYGALECETIRVNNEECTRIMICTVEMFKRTQNIYHIAFYEWNDALTQTKEGVLAGFDAAIALRKKEIS